LVICFFLLIPKFSKGRIPATLGITQTSFLQDSWLQATKLKQV
jgi:hypothetical protein